jgi:cellobiose-specific phosphotransferase system component IIC
MNTDAWAQVYAALAAANAAYDAANAAYAQANTANSGVTTIITTGTGASLGLVIALS